MSVVLGRKLPLCGQFFVIRSSFVRLDAVSFLLAAKYPSHLRIHTKLIHDKTLQSKGHDKALQSKGHDNTLQSKGHDKTLQSKGHDKTLQSKGHDKTLQSKGGSQVPGEATLDLTF